LAERASLSPDAIRRMERGRMSPTLGTLIKLADGLGVELATLVEGIPAGRTGRPLGELTDFLSARTDQEIGILLRVASALFDRQP
jgi:transcriptional regulator with XRE-family HTH domain